MKKIINGKMYDTNTAKSISEYENDYSPADFSYFRETLYKKKQQESILFTEQGTQTANMLKVVGTILMLVEVKLDLSQKMKQESL